MKNRLFFSLFLSVILFFQNPAPAAVDQNSLLHCSTVPELMLTVLRNHISRVSRIDDALVDRVVDQFVKRMDGSKSILWQEDVDKVQTAMRRYMQNLREPQCDDVMNVKNLLVARAKSQLEFAKTMLGPSYKLDENVQLVLDPDKRKYPVNKKEADERQTASIHFQISNYLLTDMKLPEAKKQLIHRYELIIKRVGEMKPDDFYDAMVNALARALDPHSDYMSPDTLEDFRIGMGLSLEGIGASLSNEDGYTVIQELIGGGSAAKSGRLEPKDKIIAVGQGESGPLDNVIDMDLRDVVKKIRGKAGTKVRLTILRAGKSIERFTLPLVRSKVSLEADAASVEFYDRTVNGKKMKLARIDLPSFYGDENLDQVSCYRDMLKAVEKINKAKVDGVVLDLSQNGGGRLEEAVKIAGLFLKAGNVVATKNSQKEVDILDDTDPKVQYSGPMVVLISRLSASASEIVAGALQDYKRAVIVGADHTYGKGSVQAVMNLMPGMGAFKITTGLFFIPSGNSTQHRGVISDIPWPSAYSTSDMGEQYLDNSMRPDAIPNFLSSSATDPSWRPVSESEVEKLRKLSTERTAKDKDLQEIARELKEAEDRKGIIKLADFRKKDAETKKKEDKKGKKRPLREVLKERNLPHINESLNVLSDLVQLRSQKDAPAPHL